jgi:clan AA aspartic protease
VLHVRPKEEAEPIALTVWVDTAFTGDLVIPRHTIAELKLSQSAAVLAALADGNEVVLDCYSCIVDWFGDVRAVEVIENDGALPLLGVGLLQGRKLEVDYRLNTLTVS